MIKGQSGKTTFLLIILIIISLGLAGGVFYLFQQEQARSIELQAELDELSAKYSVAEGKVRESDSIIKNLDSQLQEAKGKLESSGEELRKAQEAQKVAEEELGRIKADLDTQQSLRVKLENELNSSQTALKKAQKQLKELEGKKNLLETKIGTLEKKTSKDESDVELGTIVVAPPDAQTAVTSPVKQQTPAKTTSQAAVSEGKVLVVNKEYNFAVINLGSKDGAALGDVFYVYHSNKYIGDITLEKIHDSMAAAGFTSSKIKSRIAEGDRVVKKKK
jgi:hypothetical protein